MNLNVNVHVLFTGKHQAQSPNEATSAFCLMFDLYNAPLALFADNITTNANVICLIVRMAV